jgi:hypothetical protein
MISRPIAVAFTLSSFTIAVSAAVVAMAEPGVARVSAGAVSLLLFLLVVFGLAGVGQESQAALIRRLLVAASRQPTLWSSVMLASAIVAVYFGPWQTEMMIVHCFDAKRVERQSIPGQRMEECAEDRNAAFTAWHPLGRPRLLRSIQCQYSSGDYDGLLQDDESCPIHEFTYIRPFAKTDKTWHWTRGFNGVWQERASSTSEIVLFNELGVLDTLVPDLDETNKKRPIKGMRVRRQDPTYPMEVLVPRSLVKNEWLYWRPTERDDWERLGAVLNIQAEPRDR